MLLGSMIALIGANNPETLINKPSYDDDDDDVRRFFFFWLINPESNPTINQQLIYCSNSSLSRLINYYHYKI